MPVATLDDSVIGTQGLSKPTPKRAREPREPDKPTPKAEPVIQKPDPRQVDDDAPIRMPSPFDGEPVNSEPVETEPQPEPEMNTKEIYRLILSDEYREITKRILTDSEEGKELLAEIQPSVVQSDETNQLSAWEIECISQLRSLLNQYPETELEVTVHLQVSLPVQPFSFIVKR